MVARKDFTGGAVVARLNADITSSSTTIVLAATPGATGWPTGANGEFGVVIDRGNAGEEKLLGLSRSGTSITLASAGKRGLDGTTAAAHTAGVTVEHCFFAGDADAANEHVSNSVADPHTQYLLESDNLGSLASASMARTNLGLGSLATLSAVASAQITDGTIATGDIANDAVTNAILANMANATVKGRNTAGTGDPEDVTMAQLKTLLALVAANISDFNAAVDARIPAASAAQRVKAADESVTSSTVLQNDDELLAAVAASSRYAFDGFLYVVTAATPDFKMAFTVPAGATLTWDYIYADATIGVTNDSGGVIITGSGTPASLFCGSGTVLRVWFRGFVLTAGTPGNLQMQFAQNTSSATATTVKAGSALRTQVGT